jgi:type I restriction enzyme R subunit
VPIKGNDDAAAFFGILEPAIEASANGQRRDDAALIALALIDIIKAHHIVDVWSNDVAQNKMRNAIDDYFFDVARDRKGIEIPVEQLDELETRIMNLARARFPG